MNGLVFPRHEEETAVTMFGRCIREAAQSHVKDPTFWPLIPNWSGSNPRCLNFWAS